MDLPGCLVEDILVREPPTIIAVSGFGGAGKSSFAAALARRIDAPIVGVDSFLINRTMSCYARWEVMDFDRLEREVLQPFSGGYSVRYGHFDWARNAIREVRDLPANGRLIVEGVGLFRPGLLKYLSLLVWVHCPLHEAIKRGKRRDREEYGHPQDEAWDGIWRKNDEECYHAYQPEKIAHYIVNNPSAESGSPVAALA